MKRYIWILRADMAPHLNRAGGVSAAYILPKSYAPEDPTDLAGGRIWLVLRGKRGDALFAHISVEMVEQFVDGANAGDFLLTTDFAKSYRCSIFYDSGIVNFPIRETASFSIGLNVVEEDIFATLAQHVKSATAIKLQKPTSTILSKIEAVLLHEASAIKSENVIAATTGRLSLEEVWGCGKAKLPPFANFAYHALLKTYGEVVAQKLIDDLSFLDPTMVRAVGSNSMEATCDRIQKPVVDVNLLPIDPDRIYARRFIARCQNPIDLADIVEKTANAEKRHQDMLRELVIKLKSMGLSPLQSSSIDLLVGIKNSFSVFELKTATQKNIMSQAAKGVFQLGCYKAALKDEGYISGKQILVMETTGVQDLDSYILDVVSTLGVYTLFYDLGQPWPNRLNGLEKLISCQ